MAGPNIMTNKTNNAPLLTRLQRHYQDLDPDDNTAMLLHEAMERIMALNEAINEMPSSKIACGGVLLVPIERYNRSVDIANG